MTWPHRGRQKTRRPTLAADRHAHHESRWVLHDIDGKPPPAGADGTRIICSPVRIDSRGLNGMEAQTYMHTAYALTGDARFQQGLEQLIKWRYPAYTVDKGSPFLPIKSRLGTTNWLSSATTRSFAMPMTPSSGPFTCGAWNGAGRSFACSRPLLHFIYSSITSNDCEAAQAAQYLA